MRTILTDRSHQDKARARCLRMMTSGYPRGRREQACPTFLRYPPRVLIPHCWSSDFGRLAVVRAYSVSRIIRVSSSSVILSSGRSAASVSRRFGSVAAITRRYSCGRASRTFAITSSRERRSPQPKHLGSSRLACYGHPLAVQQDCRSGRVPRRHPPFIKKFPTLLGSLRTA